MKKSMIALILSLTLFLSPARAQSTQPQCLEEYHARTRQLVKHSTLGPLVHLFAGAVGTGTLALLGSGLGRHFAQHSSTGGLIGASWGITLGFYGFVITFVGREAIVISKLIDNIRAQALLEEAYGIPGKMSEKFERKLKDRGILLQKTIPELIRELDQSQALCNGEMRGHSPDAKLKKRIVGFRRLLKLVSGGKYTEDLKAQAFLEHSTTQSTSHSSEETSLPALLDME